MMVGKLAEGQYSCARAKRTRNGATSPERETVVAVGYRPTADESGLSTGAKIEPERSFCRFCGRRRMWLSEVPKLSVLYELY